MIDFEQLRFKQAVFEGKRKSIDNNFKTIQKEWNRFLRVFPIEKIMGMSLDEYVVGKDSKDSFCYWIENRLNALGNIHGATAFKFGIYFGRTKSDSTYKYRFTRKFGDNENEAFHNVKKEIISLLDSALNNNIENIKNNKLSPMFKGKLLFVYFQQDFLSIYSYDHLKYFLNYFNIKYHSNSDEIDMRRLLLNFKNEDEIMKGWSTFEFGYFLYEEIGYPLRKRDIPKESQKYYEFEEDYPNIDDVNPLFLEMNIHPDNISDSESIATKRTPKKLDFEKQNNSFRVIGTRGEEIVLKAEKDYLRSIGKRNLIKDVIHVSETDDSLGYDILSFDENGIEKYIEVKSTKASPGTNISFILSSNQYMKAKELNNYYLYLVFDVKTLNPRIWKIKNPLSYENKGLSLIPSIYKATIITLPIDS